MNVDQTHGRVVIHDTAHVEDTATIIGPCEIWHDAYIGHNAVIGAPPQYRGYFPSPMRAKRADAGVKIWPNATIRELCQVHQGISRPTEVGAFSMLMAGCHVGHDSLIDYQCTLAPFSLLAGHTHLMDGVTFGQNVITHPWVVVGKYAMVGLGAVVIRDVLPYQKVVGNPARLIGKNTGSSGDKEEWSEEAVAEPVMDAYHAACRKRDEAKKLMKEKVK